MTYIEIPINVTNLNSYKSIKTSSHAKYYKYLWHYLRYKNRNPIRKLYRLNIIHT